MNIALFLYFLFIIIIILKEYTIYILNNNHKLSNILPTINNRYKSELQSPSGSLCRTPSKGRELEKQSQQVTCVYLLWVFYFYYFIL